jgi:catechol 2,3-dioxygenase-like lactoylglutathione lyase family enzyme
MDESERRTQPRNGVGLLDGVAIEQIVDWPTGGRSVYFRDPAGNSLELTSPSIWGIQDA